MALSSTWLDPSGVSVIRGPSVILDADLAAYTRDGQSTLRACAATAIASGRFIFRCESRVAKLEVTNWTQVWPAGTAGGDTDLGLYRTGRLCCRVLRSETAVSVNIEISAPSCACGEPRWSAPSDGASGNLSKRVMCTMPSSLTRGIDSANRCGSGQCRARPIGSRRTWSKRTNPRQSVLR